MVDAWVVDQRILGGMGLCQRFYAVSWGLCELAVD